MGAPQEAVQVEAGVSCSLGEGVTDVRQGHGRYYWRCDAVDYLRHYPIRVADEAIAHFSANNWTPPRYEVGSPEFGALFDALNAIYGAGRSTHHIAPPPDLRRRVNAGVHGSGVRPVSLPPAAVVRRSDQYRFG